MATLFSQGTRANVDHFNIGNSNGAGSFNGAAQFSIASNATITAVSAYIETVGSPSAGTLVPHIYSDTGSNVPNVSLAVGTAFSGITGSYTFISTPLTLAITAGTKYWLVLSRTDANNTSNYFNWSISSTSGGKDAIQDGGTLAWTVLNGIMDMEIDGNIIVPANSNFLAFM